MLLAALLVTLGSVAHATWNLLATRAQGSGTQFVWAYSLCSLVLLVPVGALAMIGGARLSWTLVGASLVSGLMHGSYALALQAAYTRSDLNVAYPIARGLGPVLVVVWAVLVLAEPMRPLGWAGLALTVAGVVAVTGGLAGASPGDDGVGRGVREGVRWGLLVAVTIAAYTLWDDRSMTALGLDPVLYHACTGVFMVAGLSLAVRGRYAESLAVLRRQWPVAAAIGVLVPVAYVLVLIAMTMAPISVIAPLRSTSIALGSVMAWLWLREPHGPRRLAGAALITVGVVALVSQ